MTRAFTTLALVAALWIIDPVIASAMERHPTLVEIGMWRWPQLLALCGGIMFALLVTVSLLALLIVGARQDRESGE